MSKQDRQGARTPADLERKYNFGKSFAEVMGLARDAQDTANKAKEGVSGLDEKLDHEEIFNRLTKNGALKGIYRGKDGEIYINATYILTGALIADLIKSGMLKSKNGMTYFDLDNGQIVASTSWGDRANLSNSELEFIQRVGEITKTDIKTLGITHSSVTFYNDDGTPRHWFESLYGAPTLMLTDSNDKTSLYPLAWLDVGGAKLLGREGDAATISPPMELGVEYRTTEQYLGKPVYQRAYYVGALPNASYIDVQYNIANLDRVVGCHGFTNSNMVLPNISTSSSSTVNLITGGDYFRITTATNRSNLAATVVLKYTKTTD